VCVIANNLNLSDRPCVRFLFRTINIGIFVQMSLCLAQEEIDDLKAAAKK